MIRMGDKLICDRECPFVNECPYYGFSVSGHASHCEVVDVNPPHAVVATPIAETRSVERTVQTFKVQPHLREV